MREIKFRAWQAHNSLTRKAGMYPVESIHFYEGRGGGEAFLGNDGTSEFFEDIKLMQYTGLKDTYEHNPEDRTEAHEGDIIRFSYGIPGVQVIAPIDFVDGAFYAITKGHNPAKILVSELEENIGEWEVIGNIYENPELLPG